ncbi:MAG: hypothetical protein ACRDY7_19040 [Acidimicrobiia bacterium]
MGIGKGQEWGGETTDPPAVTIGGADADLAAAVAGAAPGALVRFSPSPHSDVARALGLSGGDARVASRAVPMDALSLDGPRGAALAVNAVVSGVAPDRLDWRHVRRAVDVVVDGSSRTVPATTVVVLVGQYLRGADVSPRGHPGDGVAEVQIYGLAPGQRRAMRDRLGSGAHLPHPGISTQRARRVEIRWHRPVPLEIDGRAVGQAATLTLCVVPGAYRLLV